MSSVLSAALSISLYLIYILLTDYVLWADTHDSNVIGARLVDLLVQVSTRWTKAGEGVEIGQPCTGAGPALHAAELVASQTRHEEHLVAKAAVTFTYKSADTEIGASRPKSRKANMLVIAIDCFPSSRNKGRVSSIAHES